MTEANLDVDNISSIDKAIHQSANFFNNRKREYGNVRGNILKISGQTKASQNPYVNFQQNIKVREISAKTNVKKHNFTMMDKEEIYEQLLLSKMEVNQMKDENVKLKTRNTIQQD